MVSVSSFKVVLCESDVRFCRVVVFASDGGLMIYILDILLSRTRARSKDSKDKAQRGMYKVERYSRYGASLVNKSFIAQLKLHELDFLYSN